MNMINSYKILTFLIDGDYRMPLRTLAPMVAKHFGVSEEEIKEIISELLSEGRLTLGDNLEILVTGYPVWKKPMNNSHVCKHWEEGQTSCELSKPYCVAPHCFLMNPNAKRVIAKWLFDEFMEGRYHTVVNPQGGLASWEATVPNTTFVYTSKGNRANSWSLETWELVGDSTTSNNFEDGKSCNAPTKSLCSRMETVEQELENLQELYSTVSERLIILENQSKHTNTSSVDEWSKLYLQMIKDIDWNKVFSDRNTHLSIIEHVVNELRHKGVKLILPNEDE